MVKIVDQNNLQITPSHGLHGECVIPGDKSISHRAIMLASLAEGTTQIKNFLQAQDTLATVQAFRNLGVKITLSDEELLVDGKGLYGLTPPVCAFNCGNSGTLMRLLAGILAAQPFKSVLFGDEYLLKRPMSRIVTPLIQMGAHIEMQNDNFPPLIIHGGNPLQGIKYPLPIPSSQVKSCLLLAGLYAQGVTEVISPSVLRDHTERMLTSFGYPIQSYGSKVRLRGGEKLTATTIKVPGDISSAAFFMVAATLAEDSNLLLENVGINPTRLGVINILSLMGADITFENEKMYGNEPVADIRIRSAKLLGIDIPLEQVSLAIDEFPVLFIAAACARGRTVLRGAKELRVKESDRIEAMADGLRRLGIDLRARSDGIVIEGGKIQGGHVKSYGDHRVAMAFAVAGMVAKEPVIVIDCHHIATSFPQFVSLAKQIGVKISYLD